ncbi:MAG: winged helix-turn-helix domain-containing protein [Promethearchaeota archaeon]
MQESNDSIQQFEVGCKFWIKGLNNFTMGPGDVKLIKNLIEFKNLTKAAKVSNFSYKFAWKKLKKISEKTGKAIVNSHRGGKGGGGEVSVTSWGIHLVSLFESAEKQLNKVISKINADFALKIS